MILYYIPQFDLSQFELIWMALATWSSRGTEKDFLYTSFSDSTIQVYQLENVLVAPEAICKLG